MGNSYTDSADFSGYGQLETCAPAATDVQIPARFFYALAQHFNMHHLDLEYVGHLPHGLQLERLITKVHTRVRKFCNQNWLQNPNTQNNHWRGC